MSLFGSSRPKGITKAELTYVRAELLHGRAGTALHKDQADGIIRRLELCLDADSPTEQRKGWGQASEREVEQIGEQLKEDRHMKLTDAQREHSEAVLQKYLDVNKVKGFFF